MGLVDSAAEWADERWGDLSRGAGGGGARRGIRRRGNGTEALFWHAVRTMPRLEKRLRAARTTDAFRAISEYSYTVDEKFGGHAGGGWAAVGDAAGFLDPIFSSGVHLALSSAQRASAGILEKLRTGSDRGLHAYLRVHGDAGFPTCSVRSCIGFTIAISPRSCSLHPINRRRFTRPLRVFWPATCGTKPIRCLR